MGVFECTLFVVIIVCLIIMGFVSIYNRFQINVIRINEAEANIDSTLRKKFDLLNKSINIIKNETKEKNVLDKIKKLRSMKLNNFEFDRELVEAKNEFDLYVTKYPNLKTNELFVNINYGLAETESEIEAFKRYYNDTITDYNKMVKTFPSNIVALLSSYKKRPYFDKKENKTNIQL